MGTLLMSFLRRYLCCFRSKLLTTQYDAITQECGSTTSDEQCDGIDWEDASLKLGLGRACSICGDEARVKTHAAPCGHSACEACWGRWLQQSQRCMVCNAPCQGVVQASRDLVPINSAVDATDDVVAAVERAVSVLVELKQDLSGVKCKLEEATRYAQDASSAEA